MNLVCDVSGAIDQDWTRKQDVSGHESDAWQLTWFRSIEITRVKRSGLLK